MPLFNATVERTKIHLKVIVDIQVGSVSQPGACATSENVAAKYGISREVHDTMALNLHCKAITAQ